MCSSQGGKKVLPALQKRPHARTKNNKGEEGTGGRQGGGVADKRRGEGVGEKNQSGFFFFFLRLKKLFPGKSSGTNRRRLVPALKRLRARVPPAPRSCGSSGVAEVSGGGRDVLQMYRAAGFSLYSSQGQKRAWRARRRAAAAPLPLPAPRRAPFSSQLDQDALWHFKRHKLARRGGSVGEYSKIGDPREGRSPLNGGL